MRCWCDKCKTLFAYTGDAPLPFVAGTLHEWAVIDNCPNCGMLGYNVWTDRADRFFLCVITFTEVVGVPMIRGESDLPFGVGFMVSSNRRWVK